MKFEMTEDFWARFEEFSRAADDNTDAETGPECQVLPAPPPVPVEAFPELIQAIINDAARAFVVPLEVPTVAVLALAAGCIGRSRAIVVKSGWTPHANLYLALVGASGTGKSPCVNKILSAVHRVDFKLHQTWTAEHSAYEAETENYRTATKAHLHGKGADPGPPPKRPPRRRILADDESLESLVDAFNDNPRGILWQRDELAGLLLDLDKYSGKNGATKTRLMSCYDAGPIKVGRIAENRIAHIPHAALSIFGGIQPAALVDAFCTKDQLTGFLPRFLFVRFRPGGPSLWTDAVFDHDTELDHIVRGLLGLELDVQGRPVYIGMTGDARRVYIDWHDRLSMAAWMGSGDDEQSVLSKLRDQCLRLALILHLLEAVTTGTDDTAAVTAETMKSAILLAEWFREHQRAVWQLISSTTTSEQTPLIRRVASAIVDLAGEIKNGVLPTAAITDRVNTVKDGAFHVDPRAAGRACSKLGLPGKRTGSARMISISEDALNRLRAIGNVINVTNVTEPPTTSLSAHDVSKSPCHKRHTTDGGDAQGNDINDITKNNVTGENACGYRLNDVNDDNDVIFTDIPKSTHGESETVYEEGTI